jgi:O-antigen/teichoic acid export membrane protein
MKLNVREFFKLSFLYTAAAAFPPLLQLIIQPIIEGKNRLNQVDFSHLAISESITTLAFILVLFSMGSAISRFYYDFLDDKKTKNRMIASIFSSILIRGVILLSIAFIFQDNIGLLFSQKELQNFGSYGYLCLIIGINRAINLSAVTLYRNEEKSRKFITINIISGILRASFQVIGVFYFEMNFIGYLWGSLIGSGIVTLYILFDIFRSAGFAYDRTLLASLNRFSMPLFQYDILSWGLMFLDRFFLEFSPSALGIYDNAMKFAMGIQLIIQGLMGAVQPEMFRIMSGGIEKNMQDIKKLSNLMMAQAQVIVAITILPSMIFISMFYETDLRFSASLIAIIFIRFIMRAQYYVFAIPVMYLKKTWTFFYINSSVLIINIILNYLLIPHFKAYGAIIAFLTAYLMQIVLIYTVQRRLINISWNLKKVLIYPLLIVSLSIGFEILKSVYKINPYYTASLVVTLIVLSLSILYRKEILQFSKNYWIKFILKNSA